MYVLGIFHGGDLDNLGKKKHSSQSVSQSVGQTFCTRGLKIRTAHYHEQQKTEALVMFYEMTICVRVGLVI